MKPQLPWASVLRKKKLQKVKQHDAAKSWLLKKGWRYERDSFGWVWWDPVTGWDNEIINALRIQTTRDAQRLLQPLGYVLTSGSNHDGVWTWVHEVRKSTGYSVDRRRQIWAPGSRYCSLVYALKVEGFI